MAAKILCIDTSLDVCSVALAIDGRTGDLHLEEKGFNIHSARLTLMIEALLKQAKLSLKDLEAICIDKGPGSYTGLRIGVSTAKGLCYALDKPLISLNTLQTMASQVNTATLNALTPQTLLCPMIDARRMEVYYGLFDQKGDFIKETKAEVVDETFLKEELAAKEIMFFGNGMKKCEPILEKHPNAKFLGNDIYPLAQNMARAAFDKYNQLQFEEVFSFEPFYLKDFYTTSTQVKSLP